MCVCVCTKIHMHAKNIIGKVGHIHYGQRLSTCYGKRSLRQSPYPLDVGAKVKMLHLRAEAKLRLNILPCK